MAHNIGCAPSECIHYRGGVVRHVLEGIRRIAWIVPGLTPFGRSARRYAAGISDVAVIESGNLKALVYELLTKSVAPGVHVGPGARDEKQWIARRAFTPVGDGHLAMTSTPTRRARRRSTFARQLLLLS
jgi:hypothetical protein